MAEQLTQLYYALEAMIGTEAREEIFDQLAAAPEGAGFRPETPVTRELETEDGRVTSAGVAFRAEGREVDVEVRLA